MWRHRWCPESMHLRHFPIGSLLDTYPYIASFARYLASKLPTHKTDTSTDNKGRLKLIISFKLLLAIENISIACVRTIRSYFHALRRVQFYNLWSIVQGLFKSRNQCMNKCSIGNVARWTDSYNGWLIKLSVLTLSNSDIVSVGSAANVLSWPGSYRTAWIWDHL